MKKVIITGATGMIGSTLINLLSSKGIEVLAIVREKSKRVENISSKNVRVLECSLDHLKDLSNLGEYDALYHLAWDKTFGEKRDDVNVQLKNIEYTLEAVRLAQRCQCKVFIGAGSQAEYGVVTSKIDGNTPVNPMSGYGIAKYTAGKLSGLLCDQLGMRHCWARILSVYGEKDASYTLISYCIDSFIKGIKPSLTKCEQMWDYIYSEDVALALYLIGEKGRHQQIYCIGSGQIRQLRDYILVIRDIINPTIDIGFGERAYYLNQPMYLEADISALTKDTGFSPQFTFEEGIKRTIQWYQKLIKDNIL